MPSMTIVELHFLQRIFASRDWIFSSATEYLAAQVGQEIFTFGLCRQTPRQSGAAVESFTRILALCARPASPRAALARIWVVCRTPPEQATSQRSWRDRARARREITQGVEAVTSTSDVLLAS